MPGYPPYDLAKAKSLVQQLGGLTVSLGTIQNLVAQETTEALQTEWATAGIKTTIHNYPLAALIAQFTSGKWQAMVQTAGSYDPAAGVGVGFRFSSMSPFSGVHDPHLDALLNQAAGTVQMSQRCALYNQAAAYIAQQFYGPFYFGFAPANVAVKGAGRSRSRSASASPRSASSSAGCSGWRQATGAASPTRSSCACSTC